MIIRRANGRLEIQRCVQMSEARFNSDSLLTVDIRNGMRELMSLWQTKQLDVIIAEEDGKVIGWSIFRPSRIFMHSTEIVLCQLYLHTFTGKIKSVKIIKAVHEYAEGCARDRHIRILLSNSVLQSHETFDRILSSIGWFRHGPYMARELAPRDAREGTRVVRRVARLAG